MDGATILDDWSPDEATLRRWAYDVHLVLSDQDEDLVLHREESLPVLLPLADDPACPKADFILSALDFYLMFLVLLGDEDQLSAVREASRLAIQATQPKLRAWAELQQRRLQYRAGTGPVTREQALVMGEELLNGISRNTEISLAGETAETWEVQLAVPPGHRHQERLSIHRLTGRFRFSRSPYTRGSAGGRSWLL